MNEPEIGKILNKDPNLPVATEGCVIPPVSWPRKLPRYAWRPYNMTLSEDGKTFAENGLHSGNIELKRQDMLTFLDGEGRQGYRLVQVVNGPYWLFEKL